MATQSEQIAADLGLSGKYWPALISALIALSRYTRRSLQNYLLAQKAQLNYGKSTFLYLSTKGDGVAVKLNNLRVVLTELLQPVTNFFRVAPLEGAIGEAASIALQEVPEFVELMEGMTKSIPFKIPDTALTQITGLAGFDFFDGISTFQDLQDKLDEMLFRASRATALSTYASKSTYYIDAQIDKIDILVNILETLDYRGL